MKGITCLEIASITALTILFLLFASLNMGSVMMPSSCWQPPSADKEPEVVLDFGSVQQIKEVYIFLADAKRTKFDIFGGTPPDNWSILASYDNDPAKRVHFCSWERIDLGNESTRFLKFVFNMTELEGKKRYNRTFNRVVVSFDVVESKGKIGEMLVISANNKKITPVEVSGENASRLVDEQDLVKLPITQKYGAYFDEMYFVRTAKEHLNLEEPYEWTHPPLGKLIIAFGILCFGMNPFGWRILGVLAAATMIPIMFLFGKRMFKSSAAGFFAAYLMTFEFMHFSLARLATGEIYILFFSLLMFYFAFDYFSKREEEEESEKRRISTSLFLSIIFFGLCFAVKWTAVFGLVAILILLLISNCRNKKPIFDDYKIVLAGLFVSAAIYITTYIPYMLSGGGHGLLDIHRFPLYMEYISKYMSGCNMSITPPTPLTVFDLQLGMFGYHAGNTATHPFSSPWWSWPLMLKPLWMYSYSNTNTLDGTAMVSTIVLLGNPAIWWCSIPALIFIAVKFVADIIRKRECSFVSLFILIPFLLQWIPYALITRTLFIYHFAPDVPFMIFALTYWTTFLEKKGLSGRKGLFFKCVVIAFLISIAVLFFLFYPVISGYPIAYKYKESLRWLSGWTF